MHSDSPADGRQDVLRPRVSNPHPRRNLNSKIAYARLNREPDVVSENNASWDDSYIYELGPVFPDEPKEELTNG